MTVETIHDVVIHGGRTGAYENFHCVIPAKNAGSGQWIRPQRFPLSALITLLPDGTCGNIIANFPESDSVQSAYILYQNTGPKSTFEEYIIWQARDRHSLPIENLPTTLMDDDHLSETHIPVRLLPFDHVLMDLTTRRRVGLISIQGMPPRHKYVDDQYQMVIHALPGK